MKDKKNLIVVCVVVIIVLLITIFGIVLSRPKEFKVSFDTDGGSAIEAITIKKNDVVALPKNPIKEGYVFDGWVLDGKKINGKEKITKDIKLKASWIKKESDEIVITFDSNGGSKVESIILKKEESLTLPENPKREGYKFITWKDKNEVPISNGALLDSDITLFAYWEKEQVQ